jgi:hypothetical protein
MTRLLVIGAVSFALGALVTTAFRAAIGAPPPELLRHDRVMTAPQPAPPPAAVAAPHAIHARPAPIPTASASAAAELTTSASGSVNSICPICGMTVDPTLPTALYQGRVIGFGCARCPPEFPNDAQLYGEAALRNAVAE